MHDVLWVKDWNRFYNNDSSAAQYMSVSNDILTVDNRTSPTTSAYRVYHFPCDGLSEINIFTEAKLIEGIAYMGIDFFSTDSYISGQSQSMAISSSTFCPVSFKAIAPKNAVSCRITFGVWGGNAGYAMYKLPQVYISKGEGLPSICAAAIRYDGSSKTFAIINDYARAGITGIMWDSVNKCLNINLKGTSHEYPMVFVTPLGNAYNTEYVLIGENFPRSKSRVQIYFKKASDNSIVDMANDTVPNLYFSVLVLR